MVVRFFSRLTSKKYKVPSSSVQSECLIWLEVKWSRDLVLQRTRTCKCESVYDALVWYSFIGIQLKNQSERAKTWRPYWSDFWSLCLPTSIFFFYWKFRFCTLLKGHENAASVKTPAIWIKVPFFCSLRFCSSTRSTWTWTDGTKHACSARSLMSELSRDEHAFVTQPSWDKSRLGGVKIAACCSSPACLKRSGRVGTEAELRPQRVNKATLCGNDCVSRLPAGIHGNKEFSPSRQVTLWGRGGGGV